MAGESDVSCTKPMKAYRGPEGIAFNSRVGYADAPLVLSCGQCLDCRMKKTRDWGIRSLHESQMVERSCFITLTYNEINLPWDHAVDVDQWQKFAKKLRRRLGPFRFMHCGEYGEENLRPHYHAVIFGHDFGEDRVELPTSKPEKREYHSPLLEEMWGLGFTRVGDVTYSSAAYVAGYCIKKMNGDQAAKHYERLDKKTGQVWSVKPDYATMSRRPGLGTSWFQKYQNDVYPDDFVIINGKKTPPPKFYDQLLQKKDEELYREVRKNRKKNQLREEAQFRQTDEQLETHEKISRARIANEGKRNL